MSLVRYGQPPNFSARRSPFSAVTIKRIISEVLEAPPDQLPIQPDAEFLFGITVAFTNRSLTVAALCERLEQSRDR
jgi:hypothetical protein